MGKLKINIVKATFKKKVRKVRVEITSGRTVLAKTKEIHTGEKEKTLTPAWNFEEELANFDPRAPFGIEAFTSKGSIGKITSDKGLCTPIKFIQGVPVLFPFDFGDAILEVIFTAVDFGEEGHNIPGAPPEEEIIKQFAVIAHDMALPAERVEKMSLEAKWQMIQAAAPTKVETPSDARKTKQTEDKKGSKTGPKPLTTPTIPSGTGSS